MKRFLLTLISLGAQFAFGYEYKLQFTPQGGASGLTFAGYSFSGSKVIGNCSYLHGFLGLWVWGPQHDHLALQHLLMGPIWQPGQFDAGVECSGSASATLSNRDRDRLRGQRDQQHGARH
jgi:hypothetical protein